MIRSVIAKVANRILAIPLAVMNAILTLLRSSDFTIDCWYNNNPEKITAPIVYKNSNPKRAPAVKVSTMVMAWRILESLSAFFLPSDAGIEYSPFYASKL